MSTLRNLVHWLLRTPQAPRAARAAKAERCPITEWAEGTPRAIQAETDVMTYDEFRRWQKARQKD